MIKCEEVFTGERAVGLNVKWCFCWRSIWTLMIRYDVCFQWTLHGPVAFRQRVK